jgi:hypothetical protein
VDGRLGRRALFQGTLAVAAASVLPHVAAAEAVAPDPLTRSSFSPFVDSTFHVVDGGRRVPVVLSRIDDISSTSPMTREDRFSLVFTGANDPSLTQNTRRLIHPGRPTVDLFIVPVGVHRTQQTYQAIIHRRA